METKEVHKRKRSEPKSHPLLGNRYTKILSDGTTMMTNIDDKQCCCCCVCIVDMNLMEMERDIEWSIHMLPTQEQKHRKLIYEMEKRQGQYVDDDSVNDLVRIDRVLVGIAFKDDPNMMENYDEECGCFGSFCLDLNDNSLHSYPSFSKTTFASNTVFAPTTGYPYNIQIDDEITCIFSPTVGTLTFKVNGTPISDIPSITGIPLDRPLCPYIETYEEFSCNVDFPVC
jgi:hypothetical protein